MGVSDSLATALKRQLLTKFPSAPSAATGDLAASGMNPVVGRFLDAIRERHIVDETNRISYDPSEWIPADRRSEIDESVRQAKKIIGEAVAFPGSRWDYFLGTAAEQVCRYLVSPIDTLFGYVFPGDAEAVSSAVARKRIRSFGAYNQILDRVASTLPADPDATVGRMDFRYKLDEIGRDIGRAVTEWDAFAEPLFALHEEVNGSRSVPTIRLTTLAFSLWRQDVSDRIQETASEQDVNAITEAMLVNLMSNREDEALTDVETALATDVAIDAMSDADGDDFDSHLDSHLDRDNVIDDATDLELNVDFDDSETGTHFAIDETTDLVADFAIDTPTDAAVDHVHDAVSDLATDFEVSNTDLDPDEPALDSTKDLTVHPDTSDRLDYADPRETSVAEEPAFLDVANQEGEQQSLSFDAVNDAVSDLEDVSSDEPADEFESQLEYAEPLDSAVEEAWETAPEKDNLETEEDVLAEGVGATIDADVVEDAWETATEEDDLETEEDVLAEGVGATIDADVVEDEWETATEHDDLEAEEDVLAEGVGATINADVVEDAWEAAVESDRQVERADQTASQIEETVESLDPAANEQISASEDSILSESLTAKPKRGKAESSGAGPVPLWKQFHRKLNAPMASDRSDSIRARTRETDSLNPDASPSSVDEGGDSAGPTVARSFAGERTSHASRSSKTVHEADHVEESVKPLWLRYQSKSAAPVEEQVDLPAPDMAELEHYVFGRSDHERRNRFVNELFGGSEQAYTEVLGDLAAVDQWPIASSIIADKVFRRYRINIYSDVAVTFTNAVEQRFL